MTTDNFPPSSASVATCSQHDGRVAGVGAAGDGGDDHRAVAQRVFIPAEVEGDGGAVAFRSDLETLESLLQMEAEFFRKTAG